MIGIALILLIGMFQAGATQQTKDENLIINMDNAIEFQGQFSDSLRRVADTVDIKKNCAAKVHLLEKALEARDHQLDYEGEKSKAYERLLLRRQAGQAGAIITVIILFVMILFKLMAGI